MAGIGRRELLRTAARPLALGIGSTLSRRSAAVNGLSARVTVQADSSEGAVNPLLLGNNVDWTDNAQWMLADGSQDFAPGVLELADRLAPTALRYPGGTNADFFHWRDAIGPLHSRPRTRTLNGSRQVAAFGTDEFLALCKRWRAAPLITVNIATGTPAEAADWVRYVNGGRTDLPRVLHWEIGNEPYLKAHFPEAEIGAAEYVRRADAFISAMRRVDPSIVVGLAMRNDTLGGVEATPFPGFARTVLAGVRERFDFVSLHGSYFPVTFTKRETPEQLFLATMAGAEVMADDWRTTRDLLREHRRSEQIALAVTEYNALYSTDILRWGLASLLLSRTDRYIESMAGALYVADALRVMFAAPDLMMANFWSLTGNWYFGAIGQDRRPRPQFHVLEAYRRMAHGVHVKTDVDSPRMATPRAGFVPERRDLPIVTAHAVRDGDALRIAIVNRDPSRSASIGLTVRGHRAPTAEIRQLRSDGYFGTPVEWVRQAIALDGGAGMFRAERHSFSVLTVHAS